MKSLKIVQSGWLPGVASLCLRKMNEAFMLS